MKNHWVPILSIVQPTVKTGTQLFQQIGDTQKSQVFLKRKKIVRGSAPHFSKSSQFLCELFHFKFNKLRRLFTFAISNGPKNHPVFCKERVDFATNFSSLTAQQKCLNSKDLHGSAKCCIRIRVLLKKRIDPPKPGWPQNRQ